MQESKSGGRWQAKVMVAVMKLRTFLARLSDNSFPRGGEIREVGGSW
jgi:hypothetical protein